MSVLLWIIFAYVVVDRLITVAWVGRRVEITPATAVLSLLTGAFIGTVCAVAAVGGVTP